MKCDGKIHWYLYYFFPNRNPPSVHCNIGILETFTVVYSDEIRSFTLQLLPKRLQTQALFLPQHLIPLLEQDIPKGIQMTILAPPRRLQYSQPASDH